MHIKEIVLRIKAVGYWWGTNISTRTVEGLGQGCSKSKDEIMQRKKKRSKSSPVQPQLLSTSWTLFVFLIFVNPQPAMK